MENQLIPTPEQSYRCKEEELCYTDPNGMMVAEVGKYKVRMTNKQHWEIWNKMTRNERRTIAMQATIDHRRGKTKRIYDEELGKEILTNVPSGDGKVTKALKKEQATIEKAQEQYAESKKWWITKQIDKIRRYLATWFD